MGELSNFEPIIRSTNKAIEAREVRSLAGGHRALSSGRSVQEPGPELFP